MEKMIFTLTEQMKDAIQLLQRTVTVKKISGGVYPEGVLFYKDNLAAISSDLSITYKLTSEETGFVPQLFEKKIILPVKGLQLILDSAENSEITLSVEKNILSVKKNNKRGVAQIALTNEEFPEIPKLDVAGKDAIPVKNFLRAIKTTSYAMAKNGSKPLLTGMHMISDGKTLTIYAIDGFRISLWSQPYVSEKFTISIPAKTVDKLTSALSKASGDLTVVRCNGGRQAAFVIGKLVIRTHLLYGDLIDLSTIVKDKKSEVEVENRNLHFKYFDASIFKKGTCHLKFTDEAVVDALNIYVGKHKGWLPPSYGKVSYDEMNAEEQAIIDDFQGKEQYAKVLANPSKYLFETSAMLALPSEKTEK